MTVAAIIVAAGSGRRAGGVEKQFEPLAGTPVIAWSANSFKSHPQISEVIIVRPQGQRDDLDWLHDHADKIVEGGDTRTKSVLAGLSSVETSRVGKVLIHDAARPGLSHAIIDKLIAALDTTDAAAPAIAVSDALKRETPEGSWETVDRNALKRVQTPQAFRTEKIKAALSGQSNLVDDLAAIEAVGGSISFIPGDERLHKITFAEDFPFLEAVLAKPSSPEPAIRMGTGYDVHKFGDGDFVTLCGMEIPHDKGLVGHSDADVAWHALTDAILGALALGDIGDHFPPSDPQWKGAPSSVFLKHAAKLATEHGYQISNVDMTIICEAPKIKPHREAMRASTADLLQLGLSRVSLKATTTEQLGFTGRKEGMAAQASVVLSQEGPYR